MKLLTLLKRLIFVPVCASCGERLSPFPDKSLKTHGKVCLCGECYKGWLEEKAKLCTKCALPPYKCTCIPKALDTAVSEIPSLCFYEADGRGVQNKIIYSLKSTRNTELVSISHLSFIHMWSPRSNEAEYHATASSSLGYQGVDPPFQNTDLIKVSFWQTHWQNCLEQKRCLYF